MENDNVNEKLLNARLENIKLSLDSLSTQLNLAVMRIEKTITDHEERLRDVDSRVSALSERITASEVRFNEMEPTKDIEKNLWKQIAVEAIKIAIGSAGGGGLVYALLKGIN